MSDAVVTGAFTLAGALGGIALTQLFNVFSQREQYRLALYDKRLTAHQEAFALMNRLIGPLNEAKPGNAQTLEAAAASVRDWWDDHALYLDTTSRSEVLHLWAGCFRLTRGHVNSIDVWKQLDSAQRAVVKGIKMKHLDADQVQQRLQANGS